jgi:glycosyltransferase involved in cell wall biosynthesis
MRKILCLSPYVAEPITHGGSIRTRVLLAALQGLGEVHHALPVAGDEARADAARLASELGLVLHELPRREVEQPSRLRKVASWVRGQSELLARRWSPAAIARVSALLREHDFDLVVADGSHVLPLLRQTPRRLLLHLHNVEAAIFARNDGTARPFGERVSRRMESLRIARVESIALRNAVRAVTVSDVDRALALRLCPTAHVTTVPNSVDLTRMPFGTAVPEGPPRLLFVGRLDYPPNLEAVVELVEVHLPVLRAAFPGLQLRVIGEDAVGGTNYLRGRDGVSFLGRVADLLPHYATSHATYVPIRTGGGTRLKILEAFALGVPVASSGIGAEGLRAEDDVHFRRFETPEQGVAALRDLLGNRRRDYVARARALVESHYSHTAAIANLRALCIEAMTATVSGSARAAVEEDLRTRPSRGSQGQGADS